MQGGNWTGELQREHQGMHHAGQVERGIERCRGTGVEFLCFLISPGKKKNKK